MLFDNVPGVYPHRREIRDSRLYREHYSTFEEYCRERWGWSRGRAYQHIEAADTAAIVSTNVDIPAPTNEGQARELAPIARRDPGAAREAWQSANDTAHDQGAGVAACAQARAAVCD